MRTVEMVLQPVNGTKVAVLLWLALTVIFSATLSIEAAPRAVPPHPASGGTSQNPWPVLTGFLAVGLVFFTLWQYSRYRRRMEQVNAELRRSQQLLTSITENISEAIYRSSPERGLIFANRAYLKMFGYDSLEDLRSVPRERLYANPADRAKLLKLLRTCNAYANEEIEYRRKDGSTFWGLVSSVGVCEPNSQHVEYHVGAITDITARKKAEDEIRQLNEELEQRIAERTAELRASEAQFRTLVEHAPEAIVVFDGETGRFVMGNEHAMRLFGVTREKLLRLTPADVSHDIQPNGRPSSEAALEYTRRALAGETPVFEWIHRHVDGRLIPTEVRLVRLPAEGKSLLRASIIDRSERQRREKIQQATYQISEAVHTTDDLQKLYERIHSIIKSLMPAVNFYLALREQGSDLYAYAYHVDEMDPTPPPRSMKTGLNSYVLRTGKALLANRESMLDAASEWHIAAGTPSAVWLGAPLGVGGKIFGVMALQDYQNELAYGEEEKQILTFVAEQTALAIERKRAEQALRESEEKHRALFEATSQGVMLHDEHQFLEVNEATVRILGYNHVSEIIGKHPSETSWPVQMNGEPADILARQHIADCMAKGSTRFEWLARNPRRGKVPVEVFLTRIQMSGRPIIQAVINDITERKQAEEALKQKHREVVTLLNSLPGYVFFKDVQGHYVMANESFSTAVGCSKDQIVGKTDHDLFPEALAKKYRADDQRVFSSGEPLHVGEEQMVEPGRTFTVETTKVPVKDERGDVVGLIGLGFDITHRKRLEEELLKALAQEKELSQLKSNFVSMVSHEFRTPLGIIMSSAEILDEHLEQLEPAERRDHLQSIHKNTRRMAGLMEEVLLLSRVEAGKLNFEPSNIDLQSFCRRLIDELHSATNRRCPIVFTADSLPDEVSADERLLRHAFTNLLSNAIKYSPVGSAVQFDMARRDGEVICTIRDTGIGIPEGDRERLFSAFYRGGNVGQIAGTGLGLVIVKRCVELHQGKIEIESTVGQGTIVTVRFPLGGKSRESVLRLDSENAS